MSWNKFGWGQENQTWNQRVLAEKRAMETLANVAPILLYERAPKARNEMIYSKCLEWMQANGMDGGFDMTALEVVVFGSPLNWLAQLIGSCVASGAMRCVTTRTFAEVFLFNDPEEILGVDLTSPQNVAPFAPYHYGWGRKKGGLSGGDGSFCGAQIQGFMEEGMLPCSTVGLQSDAFPEPQSQSLYRQWGDSTSLLTQFRAEGRKRKLIESPKVTDTAHSKRLLEEAKPQMICSNWAFRPSYQHPTWKLANGERVWIYTRDTSNSWAHNMSVYAAVKYAGGGEFRKIKNSWGNAHKNGDWFMIDAGEHDTWLRQAESQAIGEIDLSDNAPPIDWAAA